jgi:hypothetical protein
MTGTIATVRAAVEFIARRAARSGSPGIPSHELAALSSLDEQLTPDQAAAFTADWRASPPARIAAPAAAASPAVDAPSITLEQPITPPAPNLRLLRAGRRDAEGLEVLKLVRRIGGQELESLSCISGAPGRQSFRTGAASRAGSLEPLPEGLWAIGAEDWANGRDNYSATWGPGLGAVVVPLEYSGPGRTERSAILFHLDANKTYSPGTAGCVGFYSVGDLQRLIGWIRADKVKRLYVDWGLGTCPVLR